MLEVVEGWKGGGDESNGEARKARRINKLATLYRCVQNRRKP